MPEQQPQSWIPKRLRDPKTLREHQSLFLVLTAELIYQCVDYKGFTLTETEGCMRQKRKGRRIFKRPAGVTVGPSTGVFASYRDQVHMPDSLHYSGLAKDYNLFVRKAGKLVYVRGAHPRWTTIGRIWKKLHPLCRWGGDFRSKDYNHFSLGYRGRA